MYEVLRNNKRIAVLQTPLQIVNKTKLGCETVFQLICGDTIDGYTVKKLPVVAYQTPLTAIEISEVTGISPMAVQKIIQRGIKKLKSEGLLRDLLHAIQELREIDEGKQYDYEIEFSTKVTIE